MKTKFLLPGLAMIFAIGFSFTSSALDADPDNDYIRLNNGNWHAISEVDCGSGTQPCQAQLVENGQVFPVYDSMDTATEKTGAGGIIKLY